MGPRPERRGPDRWCDRHRPRRVLVLLRTRRVYDREHGNPPRTSALHTQPRHSPITLRSLSPLALLLPHAHHSRLRTPLHLNLDLYPYLHPSTTKVPRTTEFFRTVPDTSLDPRIIQADPFYYDPTRRKVVSYLAWGDSWDSESGTLGGICFKDLGYVRVPRVTHGTRKAVRGGKCVYFIFRYGGVR